MLHDGFGLSRHSSRDEDGPNVLSRLRYKPVGIKRTRSSWTRMLITAFVMIRNQSGTQATGALAFLRSSSEDRHVPLVFFRSPPRHLKRSARLRVLSKVFYGVPRGYEKWISGNKSTSWMTSRTHTAFSWFKCIMNAFKIALAFSYGLMLKFFSFSFIFPRTHFRKSVSIIKGIVHQEMNFLSSFTHTRVFANRNIWTQMKG